MKKLFFWLGLPLRIMIIIIVYPILLAIFPKEIDTTNEDMKDMFWGRS